jgi:hypothetical protein
MGHIHPPERDTAVRDAFASVGSVATTDVVNLYGLIGGMDEMDNELWRLWPLAEVRAENKEPSPHGALFSDYLINSWCYRLQPMSPDISAVYVDRFDGKAPTLVASSLAQFFDAYLADARRVLDPPSIGSSEQSP